MVEYSKPFFAVSFSLSIESAMALTISVILNWSGVSGKPDCFGASDIFFY